MHARGRGSPPGPGVWGWLQLLCVPLLASFLGRYAPEWSRSWEAQGMSEQSRSPSEVTAAQGLSATRMVTGALEEGEAGSIVGSSQCSSWPLPPLPGQVTPGQVHSAFGLLPKLPRALCLERTHASHLWGWVLGSAHSTASVSCWTFPWAGKYRRRPRNTRALRPLLPLPDSRGCSPLRVLTLVFPMCPVAGGVLSGQEVPPPPPNFSPAGGAGGPES